MKRELVAGKRLAFGQPGSVPVAWRGGFGYNDRFD